MLNNNEIKNIRQLNIKLILKKLLKIILFSSGSILIIIIAFSIWIGISVFGGPDAMEINDYHPFKSEKAKEEFTEMYDAFANEWPVDFQDTIIKTSYGYTSVKICGQQNAKPLVLLNGGGSNSLLWIPNIEDLSKHYKIYAVEHIYDYGKSIYTKEMISADDFTTYLDELFTRLQLGDSINLMGLSYGGWISSQFALQYPERLNKLILVAPAMTVLNFDTEFIKSMIVSMIPCKYFYKNTIKELFNDATSKDKKNEQFVDQHIDLGYLALRSFKFKQMPNPTVLTDKDWQNIKMPVMYIIGENDKIYSAQKAVQRLNTVKPEIKTVILPNAGHDVTIVQAKQFNKLVMDFLNN